MLRNVAAVETSPSAGARLGERVWTTDARRFVTDLVRTFRGRRLACLRARAARQRRIDCGEERLHFLGESADVRNAEWHIAPVPHDLQDRRVEITGPVDRKMIINGLNSGARVFMADFEDATSPTWRNCLEGQAHLIDAVSGTIAWTDPVTGRTYRPAERTAVLMVRPRGWHLPEPHLFVGGAPAPAALVDFGLFLFHNAAALRARGTGPYFYLPKLESHLEARLWNDVFVDAEAALGLPPGTIKATVLIETLPAAFEMDEILFELRDHAAGLNCGRWDYIFSYIKTLRANPLAVLPDRAQVTMDSGFLRAYVQRLIHTCHRRGAHAMGGMSAYIPVRTDPAAHAAAIEQVRADKEREVRCGHDGTWVAHPGLVPIATDIFDRHMPGPHQIGRTTPPADDVTADDLLRPVPGTRTEAGLRRSLRVGVTYLASWLTGVGCVPIDNLMEDAATAEICRAQVWQWLRHRAALEDGRTITRELVRGCLDAEVLALAQRPRVREACALFLRLVLDEAFAEFLTLPAYTQLVLFERLTSDAAAWPASA